MGLIRHGVRFLLSFIKGQLWAQDTHHIVNHSSLFYTMRKGDIWKPTKCPLIKVSGAKSCTLFSLFPPQYTFSTYNTVPVEVDKTNNLTRDKEGEYILSDNMTKDS